ncbi:hypothetical protein BaRGS_00009872 [Batillaria attramentaria]|uniref:Uncharacterized protein n=1 Tax=Batillaria attramentaria TaxID=370345 RepID=A0ABD0LH92_9CAEN
MHSLGEPARKTAPVFDERKTHAESTCWLSFRQHMKTSPMDKQKDSLIAVWTLLLSMASRAFSPLALFHAWHCALVGSRGALQASKAKGQRSLFELCPDSANHQSRQTFPLQRTPETRQLQVKVVFFQDRSLFAVGDRAVLAKRFNCLKCVTGVRTMVGWVPIKQFEIQLLAC